MKPLAQRAGIILSDRVGVPVNGWPAPAIVVGGDANALGVVRSLGSAGVPVWVVAQDRLLPAMQSRYGRPFVARDEAGPGLIASLLALRKRLPEKPMLFLTHDLHVEAVSRQYAAVSDAFRIRLPSHRIVQALLHKAEFQLLAERNQCRIPRAIHITGLGDLGRLAELRFPAVVKPGQKALFFTNKAPRACRLNSLEEALRVCAAILPGAPDLVVQEWIAGRDSDIYFCLQYRGRSGRLIASFTGRKLRCWPPETGNTLTCCAAPEAAAKLEKLTTEFFDSVQFEGMCSLEFKRDQTTGEFMMVEPTAGRTDWQEEIAALCGVNIPLAAYCHELQLPAPATVPVAGTVIWRAPTCYWRSVLATRSLDRFPAGARVVRATWRSGDPLPLTSYWLRWGRRVFHHFVNACDRMRTTPGILTKKV